MLPPKIINYFLGKTGGGIIHNFKADVTYYLQHDPVVGKLSHALVPSALGGKHRSQPICPKRPLW
jgi:hypothetical protein